MRSYIRRKPIRQEAKANAIAIARACLDKKASDVLILHVAPLTSVADYLVLSSGDSDRQVRAIADYVQHTMAALRVHPLGVEGLSTAHWIVMDYADVVVHIFRADIRSHYGLEKLWSDAKRVRIPPTRDEVALAAWRAPKPKRRPARARERR